MIPILRKHKGRGCAIARIEPKADAILPPLEAIKSGKVRHRPRDPTRYGVAMTRDVPKLLALSEERVARAEIFLQKQRGLIEGLRAIGQDTTVASAMLLLRGQEKTHLRSAATAHRDRVSHVVHPLAPRLRQGLPAATA